MHQLSTQIGSQFEWVDALQHFAFLWNREPAVSLCFLALTPPISDHIRSRSAIAMTLVIRLGAA